MAGPPVRGSEGAILFGPVVPDRVRPHDVAVDAELDRAGYQAHFYRPRLDPDPLTRRYAQRRGTTQPEEQC